MRKFDVHTIACAALNGQDVVFDLDGTLISGDIGETLFYHTLLAQSGTTILANTEILGNQRDTFFIAEENLDLLLTYQAAIRSHSHRAAYLLTAEWLRRYARHDLERLIRIFLADRKSENAVKLTVSSGGGIQEIEILYGAALRADMLALVRKFRSCQANLWIVSASPQAVCEIVAEQIGIPSRQVLGAAAGEAEQIPWGITKTTLLREAGVSEPLAVFGNGEGDLDMLAAAKFPVVVMDGSGEMLAIAEARDWWVCGLPMSIKDGPTRLDSAES